MTAALTTFGACLSSLRNVIYDQNSLLQFRFSAVIYPSISYSENLWFNVLQNEV
jgi:hypothetical protein